MPLPRDPRPGPTPSKEIEEQSFPGVESGMNPPADHGADHYEGTARLDGLKAIITGGDSGMGRAIAIAYAREGADLAIGYGFEKEDEDAEETRARVEAAGRRCILHRFDVRDPEACRTFVDRAVSELDGLDVLVNHAGFQCSQPSLDRIGPDQLDRTIRTNIHGVFHMAQAVLPHMEAGACIINTGSVTALSPNPTLLDYSATKAAVHAFTQALAASVAERGIRVNCVAPGPVWTPFIPSSFPKEHVEEFGLNTVWERPAQPAELAPIWVFLASAESRYMTGEIIACTGREGTR